MDGARILLADGLKVLSDSVLTGENLIILVDYAMKELKNLSISGPEKKEILLGSFQQIITETQAPQEFITTISHTVEQLFKISKAAYTKKKCCLFFCC